MENTIIKLFLLFFLLPFSALLDGRSSGNPLSHTSDFVASPCSSENQAFQSGETIVYKLFYNWNFVWLSAGEVTFSVHDTGNDYHVAVRGRTYPSYEWFYKVRDNYESYLDKETLLPKMHIKDVQQGSYTRYDRTVFNQEKGKAVSMRGKTREELKRKEIPLSNCMHDLISIVYYARNLNYSDMRPQQEIPINILMDQEIHKLKIKYLGAENEVRVKGVGKFDTQKFSPQLLAGDVFKEGDEMTIYVSNDQNKIPVLIESPVSVGSVKAVLKSYSGLRHPFTAKK